MKLLREKRVLVLGATSERGAEVVEGLLALQAYVVAADGWRVRLDDLRARLRHHERLRIADCDWEVAEGLRALAASAEFDAVLVVGAEREVAVEALYVDGPGTPRIEGRDASSAAVVAAIAEWVSEGCDAGAVITV